jgi:hypothetical protein
LNYAPVFDYVGGTYGFMFFYKYYPKNNLFISTPINVVSMDAFNNINKESFMPILNSIWEKCSN